MKFEEKIKELDLIIEQLQDQSVELEKASELYKKGLALSEECLKELKEAKLTITTADGNSLEF